MESASKKGSHSKPNPLPPPAENRIYKILNPMPSSSRKLNLTPDKSVVDTPRRPKIHAYRVLSEWQLAEQAHEDAIERSNCILLSPNVLGTYSLSDPKLPPPPLDLELLHYVFMMVGLEKCGWHEINSVPALLWKHFGVNLASFLVKMGEELDMGGVPHKIMPTPIQPLQFWKQMAIEYDGVMEVVEILVKKVKIREYFDLEIVCGCHLPDAATEEKKRFLYFPRIPGAKKRREEYIRVHGVSLKEM